MQVRRQDLIPCRSRPVIGDRYDRNPGLLLNCLEDRVADQTGTAEDRIDMNDQAQIGIMTLQTIYLEQVLGRLAAMLSGHIVVFKTGDDGFFKFRERFTQDRLGDTVDLLFESLPYFDQDAQFHILPVTMLCSEFILASEGHQAQGVGIRRGDHLGPVGL